MEKQTKLDKSPQGCEVQEPLVASQLCATDFIIAQCGTFSLASLLTSLLGAGPEDMEVKLVSTSYSFRLTTLKQKV